MIIVTARPRTVVAVTPPDALVYHGAGEGAASAVTSTFTPQANSTLFVDGGSAFDGVAPGALAIANSAGLTFTPIIMVLHDPGSPSRMRFGMWQAAIGSSPVSMTATVTSAGASICAVCASSIRNASTDFSNVGFATSIVTQVSPSLPVAPAATSTVKGTALCFTFARWGAPTDYTELLDLGVNGDGRFNLSVNALSAAQSATFTSANTNRRSVGILLEIKGAG